MMQTVIGQTEIGFVAHLVDEDTGAVILTLIEELPGTHDGSYLLGYAQMGKEYPLVCHNAVDDEYLLGHLTHIGDTWILLRLLNDRLLDDALLFLLRIQ